MSRLEGGVAALQSRLQQLAEEREGLLGHLNGKAGSLREAEHALAKQQAKQAQQQRQAEDAAQASEKVPHTRLFCALCLSICFPCHTCTSNMA